MWPQRIEKLRVRGFKAFADASVEFAPFNVLVGANGAGKSTLLALLRMMRSLSHGELAVYVAKSGGADEVLRSAAPPTERLDVEMGLLTATGHSRYGIAMERTEDNGLLIRHEAIERFEPNGQPRGSETHTRPGRESEWGESSRWGSEHELFSQFRKYHFAGSGAAAPARLECDLDDHHELREDGGNLAAFLYRLERTHPTALRRIVATVRHVFAEFSGFALTPSALSPRRIALRWRRQGLDNHSYGAHQLSDGTLRYMLLVALLHQPHELLPPLLAVDEPELGLHPAALHSIAGLLKAASQQSQVFVATQSAALVDEYEPEDVVVMNRRDARSTLQRLDAAELKDWLAEYSLGQLWEKNVIGGGPYG